MDPFFHYTGLAITGVCVGFLSGLFGVGGGFLMTPVQYWLYTTGGMDSALATRVAFGTSLAVIIPTMIGGALAHHNRGMVNWIAAIQMGVTGIFGGFVGGALATHLPGHISRSFFALLIIMAAFIMVWHTHERKKYEIRGSARTYLPLGLGIGLVSGFAGIGGGILLVPALVILFGYPIHLASGTSSATLIFSSIGAVTAYISTGIGVVNLPPHSIGYIDILSFCLLAVTTIPLTQLGVRYAHRYPSQVMQRFFAGLALLIGVLMLVN